MPLRGSNRQAPCLNPKRDHWQTSMKSCTGLTLLAALLAAPLLCPTAAWTGASAQAQEAGEAKPKGKSRYDPEAVKHYNRALEWHNSQFLNKAIEEYKAALKVDDRLEPAYSNLGLIYISQKNLPKAQEAFEKALALKPNGSKSLNGMASVLFAQKQVQKAIDTWKKAIQFDPKFAPAYFNMGTALESQGNNQEALDAYVRAVSIAPTMADAYYRMGLLLKKMDHPAQAKVLLMHAVKIEPESEFARDARKQINAISEKFAKEGGDTQAERPVKESGNASLAEKERGSTAAGTDTPESTEPAAAATTGDAKAEDKTSTAKKRSPFKRKPKAANDEEKARVDDSKEMKMFIKTPEETDLQAKPQ